MTGLEHGTSRQLAIMFLGLAAALLILPGYGQAQESEHPSLARCLELALDHAPRLEESREALAAAEARAAEATARRWPLLDLGGSYRYTTDYMQRQIELGPFGGLDLRFGDHNQADLNLGLSIPLFTGGELSHTAEAARAGTRAAGHQLDAVRLEVKRDVRRAFYLALGRKAQLAAAVLAAERLQRHLTEVSAAVELGAASEESRLRARAGLREAEQRRLQATAAQDAAGIELGRLLGRSGSIILPAGDLDSSLLEDRDLSPARLDQRPEVIALGEEAARQELLASAVRGRFLPRLSGDLRGHFGRPGVDVLKNEWMSYGTAAVGLDWTLWDAGARRQQSRQAKALARQAEARRQDVDEAFLAAHEKAATTLESARLELDEARARADLQRRILELVGRRYGEAQASESEYLDAQDDLSEAEIQLVLAKTRVRQAEADLLWILAY
jgi:outer membrane protein